MCTHATMNDGSRSRNRKMIVIELRCCRLDWCGGGANVKWMDLACVLEVELIGLANGWLRISQATFVKFSLCSAQYLNSVNIWQIATTCVIGSYSLELCLNHLLSIKGDKL